MANPFQQKARQRKIIYLGLIVVLFTVALLHRRLIVEKQAEDLQLRETARGEVELTSSFVRLSLTGSRGLATTILWATAMDRMAKHEWNELELLVGSISKLQPYFITPWVFQSWNLAFNVAVECDRPRDKYYYVSRGLEHLAEGERRNQGTADEVVTPGRPRFPGHPEMRHYMGFYYQLKIGNSDEKNTMRSLLDLSCIDPLRRNPERFWTHDETGRQIVDRTELARLCQEHPRLVRRLREKLNYETPGQIVKFLEANRDVPTRFKKTFATDQKESELEEPRKQFPILPPVRPRPSSPAGPAWPDPNSYQMSSEALDVFLVCRTWYQYAQEPLPPPLADPGVTDKLIEYNRRLERDREMGILYRPAKTMAMEIFRTYPARAQIYIAEGLEGEGWFDDEGWLVKGWFERGGVEEEVRFGTETKYSVQPVWETAYEMYRRYGTDNGLYIAPAEMAQLERQAASARAELNLGEFEAIPPIRPAQRAKLGSRFDALQKVSTNRSLRSMTNFDAHLHQTEGEKDALTVEARKLLYQALRYNRTDQHEALPLYERAWPLWIEVALRYPRFGQLSFIQDDVYEAELKYLRLSQRENSALFRAAMTAAAPLSIAPYPGWPQPANWPWKDWPGKLAQTDKILTLRVARGPLESVVYYDGPDAPAVGAYWSSMTGVASRLGQFSSMPLVLFPDYALAGTLADRPATPPTDWHYVIDTDTINLVRERVGLIAPRPTPPPETKQ